MAIKTRDGDVNVQFTEPDNRVNLQSGESVKVMFGKIKKCFSDLKPVAFSGSYEDLTDKPSGSNSGTPSGVISAFAGAAVPDGWLLCNGTLVSRLEYAELFSVIGTNYGVGDGSTTFALPNLQSRFPYGKGGSYALGAKGGAETHALTVAEMPSHTHNLLGDVQNADGSYTRQGYGWRSSMVTGATGGNQPHNNMPPYLVVNYIIKT